MPESSGISANEARHVRGNVYGELEFFIVGSPGEELADFLRGLVQIEVQALEVEPSGLDLGEIQQVVDGVEEEPTRTECRFGEMTLVLF